MNVALVLVRSLLCLGLAAYGAYAGITVWAARSWRRTRRRPDPNWTPAVTILKPVCGIDAHAYENFASFCRLDYPAGQAQLVFGALQPDDPALELVRRLQQEYPDREITCVAGGGTGTQAGNRKVANLLQMLPSARHELLVLCDSDMRVAPDYLRRVLAPFRPEPEALPTSGRRVGMVTCPYLGCRPESFAAVLETLGIGADFLPGALASRALEGVSFAFGSTIALSRNILRELGGFEALADELADDFRLGDGARRHGYTVVLSDCVVEDTLGAERFRAMWLRRLRWARTVRACRPGGYAGSIVTHGFALATLLLLTAWHSPAAWLLWGAVLAVRLGVVAYIAGCCTEDRNTLRFLPLLPLSDVVSFVLFVASFCGNDISWRGERFRLLPGGKLAPIPGVEAPRCDERAAESVRKTGREDA